MDHDHLFKELLTTFFVDFLDVFCPELAKYLEPGSVEFLDKEVFTDVTHGERHEVDLVAKARFRGQPLGFLIHVEAQARKQTVFPQRMFTYFARFHEKYDLPVYPIARIFLSDPNGAGARRVPNRLPGPGGALVPVSGGATEPTGVAGFRETDQSDHRGLDGERCTGGRKRRPGSSWPVCECWPSCNSTLRGGN